MTHLKNKTRKGTPQGPRGQRLKQSHFTTQICDRKNSEKRFWPPPAPQNLSSVFPFAQKDGWAAAIFGGPIRTERWARVGLGLRLEVPRSSAGVGGKLSSAGQGPKRNPVSTIERSGVRGKNNGKWELPRGVFWSVGRSFWKKKRVVAGPKTHPKYKSSCKSNFCKTLGLWLSLVRRRPAATGAPRGIWRTGRGRRATPTLSRVSMAAKGCRNKNTARQFSAKANARFWKDFVFTPRPAT